MLTTRRQVNEHIQTNRTYFLKNRSKEHLIKTKEGKNWREGKAVRNNGELRGFPGGAVVENLSANAGDMGSSLGLGGSHMPRRS